MNRLAFLGQRKLRSLAQGWGRDTTHGPGTFMFQHTRIKD